MNNCVWNLSAKLIAPLQRSPPSSFTVPLIIRFVFCTGRRVGARPLPGPRFDTRHGPRSLVSAKQWPLCQDGG